MFFNTSDAKRTKGMKSIGFCAIWESIRAPPLSGGDWI